ncbi:hypothetical protein J3R30DRAFT_3733378 [Lentinula aciculospora]|uniref:F-box domain-containing protein n=1 Tax=Lentinula aciculospora TaxID=153920 RepID=A0A9W9ABH9_9AGAR|nr:hypothetical protein J3R30DRAFT_3733378 [Lentinula aciculospora]
MDHLYSYADMVDVQATPIPDISITLRKLRYLSMEDLDIDRGIPDDETLDLPSSPYCKFPVFHSHLDFILPSLFDRLPTEMIVMVFSFLDISQANLLDVNDGPWVLTQVCRRWRDIVVHCPLFWTHANLDLSCWHFTRTWPSSADLLVSTFLERSKELPLNVQIHWSDIEGAPNHILNAVEHILNTSYRWKIAILDLHFTVYYELSSMIRARLPQLEGLMLMFNLSPKTSRNTLPTIDAFQYAPKLRQVSIEGMPCATKNLQLPWDQLTHLNAYHDHPNPNYHCLRLSSSLVECHIGSHGDLLQSPKGIYPPISLPCLKKLFVKGTGALVLTYMVALNIEVLHVTDTPPAACSEACIEAVQYFILGCSESLKDLTLHSNPLDYRVAEILYSTRELIKLSLHLALPKGSSLFKDLLKWLSYRDVPRLKSSNPSASCSSGLLPRLESLSMRIDPCSAGEEALDGMDVVALAKMLVSRWTMPRISESHRGLKQLESFDLEVLGSSPRRAEFSTLEALNEMGLKTRVIV